jgi:death-on-curing family protein
MLSGPSEQNHSGRTKPAARLTRTLVKHSITPYRELTEVAAAYLFYLYRNHSFADGNKRAALGACIVFLRLNGIEPRPDGPEWMDLTMAVASSALDRAETTARLRELIPKNAWQPV